MKPQPKEYPTYQQRQQQQLDVERSRRGRLFRQFTVGAEFRFQPAKGLHARTGETVVIVRPPRNDVAHPSIRVQFADGTQESVAPGQLHSLKPVQGTPFHDRPAPEPDPPIVEDARKRPTWERILNAVDAAVAAEVQARLGEDQNIPDDLAELNGTEAPPPGSPHELLAVEVRTRIAQLVGMIARPGASPAERQALAEQLREYAERDAQARRPGRAGRPLLRHVAPKTSSTLPLTPEQLDQQARRMHNVIARCIHLRYFLSDALPRERGPRVSRAVRQAIRDAGQAEDRSIEQPAPRAPRASELHREAADAYQGMVGSALEVCALLLAGKETDAHALLERHRAQRHDYVRAEREKAALRPQMHTGRYFHGDILSVRDEHLDEEAAIYEGMTQYYTRLTIVYGEDGHSVVVANAAELEASAGVHVGEPGWRDLCRWIQDASERHLGKKQGRRQDDDHHLIYRDQDGSLVLRDSVRQQYPALSSALECVRLSLPAEFNDVDDAELPPELPGRGFHPPPASKPASMTHAGT